MKGFKPIVKWELEMQNGIKPKKTAIECSVIFQMPIGRAFPAKTQGIPANSGLSYGLKPSGKSQV